MKWFNERSVVVAFALIVVLLTINAALSYRALMVLIENERLVAHSNESIAALEQLLSTMKDAETGQRGYIITGNDSYLDPYREALASVDSQITTTRLLVADNPAQQRRFPGVERLIRHRLNVLDRNIVLRKTHGVEAASESIINGLGKRIMDSLRTSTNEMEIAERTLLDIRSRESSRSGTQAILTFIIANVVAVALVIAVYFLMNRDINLRVHRERELRAAHDELEQRVRERTSELSEANTVLNSEIAVRRQAQARLQQFTVELERSNRELQDFAFVASHDLQEPLRKIQAFGDRLKTKYAKTMDAVAADYIERMQAAAQRMHTLINDLLTFSRVSSKAQPFVPVNLATIAREVLGDLEVRIQQTGGQVELGTVPSVEADALQMRQLLQNLIGNALKFHRPGVPPRVTVRGEIVSAPGDGSVGLCEIRVEDNGIGFEEQYIEKIFTPFQRLHGRTEYEGTGMGLAVCRKIVERHKGTITARSVPGTGTTFIVQLPITQNNIKSGL